MKYKFNASGHPNIQATHKTTLEFTKDNELSLRGDCIVGVKANFDLKKLKEFIKNSKNDKITIKIAANDKKIQETIYAELNQNFNSNAELIIRKTDFISERTFAISSNKAAFELKRDLIYYLKEKKNKINIVIEPRH